MKKNHLYPRVTTYVSIVTGLELSICFNAVDILVCSVCCREFRL